MWILIFAVQFSSVSAVDNVKFRTEAACRAAAKTVKRQAENAQLHTPILTCTYEGAEYGTH